MLCVAKYKTACDLFKLLCAGWKSRDSVPKLVDEYMAGQLKVNEFVSHNLALDKINEAFDLMHSGERWVSHLLQNILTILLISHIINKYCWI